MLACNASRGYSRKVPAHSAKSLTSRSRLIHLARFHPRLYPQAFASTLQIHYILLVIIPTRALMDYRDLGATMCGQCTMGRIFRDTGVTTQPTAHVANVRVTELQSPACAPHSAEA